MKFQKIGEAKGFFFFPPVNFLYVEFRLLNFCNGGLKGHFSSLVVLLRRPLFCSLLFRSVFWFSVSIVDLFNYFSH